MLVLFILMLNLLITSESLQLKSGLLFLHTKTSGKFPHLDAHQDSLPYKTFHLFGKCRLVELSAVLCDENSFDELSAMQLRLRHEYPTIPYSEHEFDASIEEVELPELASRLQPLLDQSRVVIAHGADFHLSVIKSELERFGGFSDTISLLDSVDVLCTQDLLFPVPGFFDHLNYPKVPTLENLYEHITKRKWTSCQQTPADNPARRLKEIVEFIKEDAIVEL